MSSLLLCCALAQDLENVLEYQKRMEEFCQRVSAAYVFIGGGSGVVISPDGWMLTNHHVAGETGGEHAVHLTGGKSYKADVIGHDPTGDVSLLKIRDAADLPFLDLGSSDDLEIGQFVVAVGNPFGLGNGNWDPTVTFGVISAIHRYQDWYMDCIHTDTHINPGNSGGPLITMEGKIIGINGRGGFMRRRTRVSSGIGLAISSSQIRRFLPSFKAGGRVYHGIIEGITIAEGGFDEYENSGVYGEGILVAGVDAPSRAEEAGLKPGDIIFEIGGYPCYNVNRYHGIVGSHPIGSKVKVKVRRLEGEVWTDYEAETVLGDPEKALEGETAFRAVLHGFAPAYEQGDDGLRINSVLEKGPAEAAGMRAGDVLVEADGAPIRQFADFVKALVDGKLKAGDVMKLKVKRGDGTVDVELKLGANANAPERGPDGPMEPRPPDEP